MRFSALITLMTFRPIVKHFYRLLGLCSPKSMTGKSHRYQKSPPLVLMGGHEDWLSLLAFNETGDHVIERNDKEQSPPRVPQIHLMGMTDDSHAAIDRDD